MFENGGVVHFRSKLLGLIPEIQEKTIGEKESTICQQKTGTERES